MRELREVDPLGAGHRFVRTNDGKGQDVELLLHHRIGDAADDVGERTRLGQLGFDDRFETGLARASMITARS